MSGGLPNISRGDEKPIFGLRKTQSDVSFIHGRGRPKTPARTRTRLTSGQSTDSFETAADASISSVSGPTSSSNRSTKKRVAKADKELEALLEDVNAMTNGVDKLLYKLRFRNPNSSKKRYTTRTTKRPSGRSFFQVNAKSSIAKAKAKRNKQMGMRAQTKSLPNLGTIKERMARTASKKRTSSFAYHAASSGSIYSFEGNDGKYETSFDDMALGGSLSPSSNTLQKYITDQYARKKSKRRPKHTSDGPNTRRETPKSATARATSPKISNMTKSADVARAARSASVANVARPPSVSGGSSMQYGVCSIAGSNYGSSMQKPNQDSYQVVDNFIEKGQMLFAVFDGHGPQGGKVSRFCTNNIAQILKKLSFTPEKAPAVFTSAFLRLQRMLHNAPFDAVTSGATALVCIITPKGRRERKIIVASIGDSRCCFVTTENKLVEHAADAGTSTRYPRMNVKAHFFHPTTHSPDEPGEARRIIHAGGYVWQGPGDVCRVWLTDPEAPDTDLCGIAMSRSMGDFQLHMVGVTCTPEVVARTLSSAQLQAAEDASGHTPFVVLGTDGVWDQFDPQEVGSMLYRAEPSSLKATKSDLTPTSSAKERCMQLCKEAVSRWKSGGSGRVDDVTAIVIKL